MNEIVYYLYLKVLDSLENWTDLEREVQTTGNQCENFKNKFYLIIGTFPNEICFLTASKYTTDGIILWHPHCNNCFQFMVIWAKENALNHE